MNYHEIMWSSQKPDVYDGPACDGIRPDWECFSEGDKDGPGSIGGDMTLAAEHFPAGTKMVISVPCCPQCDCPADHESTVCDCGFDWAKWTREEFG